MLSILIASVFSQTCYPPYPPSPQRFPEGCRNQSVYPDGAEALRFNWFNGNRVPDRCAPLGPRPAVGQMVYIRDPLNFCILLPDPNAGFIQDVIAAGRRPTILEGEGYVQSFCIGELSTGGWPMPTGGIQSAHIISGTMNGQRYIQISGSLGCDALNIDCTATLNGLNNDAAQYDTAPYENYGKEPYSGVDARFNPGMTEYVIQHGTGIYCMRVCERGPSGGLQTGDPCNVKNDTLGCYGTMDNPNMGPGWDVIEGTTTRSFTPPPLTGCAARPTTSPRTSITGSSSPGGVPAPSTKEKPNSHALGSSISGGLSALFAAFLL